MCERVPVGNGGFAIVCRGHRRGRRRVCSCGREANLLCDGPGVERGQTCDRPICAACATPGGRNIDYCREHDTPAKRRLAL
jgi:hypothetical protein